MRPGPINAIVFAPLQSLVTLRLWGCLSVTAFAAPARKNTFSSDSIPTGTPAHPTSHSSHSLS